MKTRKHLVLGAALALAIAAAAFVEVAAQPPAGTGGRQGRGNFDPAQMFDRMDANSDGVIESSEFRGPAEMFNRMDADGDGKVTRAEFDASRESFRGGAQQAQPAQAAPQGFQGRGATERLRQRLGVTDEEWTVLQPRIQAISDLRTRMEPAPQFRGGPGGAAPQVAPEVTALQSTLENEAAAADDIKAKLEAYREARKKNEEAVKAAQDELRELVTVRQEALLTLYGYL